MSQTECNCAALRQASRYVTRIYDEALAPAGLGINQYSILARLDRLGPLMLQDLARALVMDRSTVGHLARPLEARGLLVLKAGAGDARCRLAALTPAGRALLAEARPFWLSAQARFEQAFGPEAARALRSDLSGVTALQVATSEGTPP